MITVEDCLRKAAQWLGDSQSTSDPTTSASMRRASDAWNTLAERIEHTAGRQTQSTATMRRPADLARPRELYYSSTVQAGDVLRGRLNLGDETSDGISE
jgi:hypothetical protein